VAILLIRHAETASNAARVVQHPDTPLSPRGEAQAGLLARRLGTGGVARILASDYARAARTAEHLRDATGAPLELEPLLRERNFGAIRGTAYADLGFDLFAPGYRPPDGEDWDAFHTRVDAAWERIRSLVATVEGHLAVVTHGLVCHSLVDRHLAYGSGERPGMRFDNAALTRVSAAPPWRITRLNCTAHLTPDATAGGAPA
jgi:probable phosphoglycerate mutase